MKRSLLALFVGSTLALAACGEDAPQCDDVSSEDFQEESGWELTNYSPRTTEQGCFPFRSGADEVFGEFISMRTSETAQNAVDVCEDVLTAINCGTYSNGDDTLSFYVRDADRLQVEVVGTLRGNEVESMVYFNPCQAGCLSFVALDTIAPEAQKICDIPSQGFAECLFPETAHSLTFLRAGEDAVELRVAGETLPVLARQ